MLTQLMEDIMEEYQLSLNVFNKMTIIVRVVNSTLAKLLKLLFSTFNLMKKKNDRYLLGNVNYGFSNKKMSANDIASALLVSEIYFLQFNQI